MKIVVCWSNISGYMAACWRELAARPGVDLFVLAFGKLEGWDTAFNSRNIMEGIPHRLLSAKEQTDAKLVRQTVLAERPDVVFISGWSHSAYRRLVLNPTFSHIRFVLCMDNPRRYTLRQTLGKIKLRRFLQRIDCVFVPGERSWQLAKYLGMEEKQIKRGCTYGVDYARFSPLYHKRESLDNGWPRRFLFIGRYVEIKGIEVLLTAYEQYRRSVEDPWPLICCGMGPMAEKIRYTEGATDKGFQQPDAIRELFLLNSGVLVLPSLHDAWPLTIVEGCAAGLPIVCSEACGSAVELVRPYYNGLTTPTADPDALTKSLSWMHEHHDELPEMGRRSIGMAAPYSAEYWADRVLNAVEEIL